MISLQSDRLRSILCIGAHADDIEIGCGGTILKLLEANPDIKIVWVVLSGEGERAGEARAAADRVLKKAVQSEIVVRQFADTCFPYTDAQELKEYFRTLSSTCEPDLVFTHRRDDLHQDHRFVAELTWQHFRNHVIMEYEIPKFEGDLGNPSVFVPLPEDLAERKIEVILSAFSSQHNKRWFKRGTFEALLRLRGIECNSPSGFAEAFHCRKLVLA